MPKVKTIRAAAKRFKSTKSGKFKCSKSFRGHLKTAKSPKRRRNLRRDVVLSPSDMKRVKGMLPYA
jgi:large subunit ribosomal protein L35